MRIDAFRAISDHVEKEKNLTLFFGELSARLAEDLEWALARLEELKATPTSFELMDNTENAVHWIKAQSHLQTQRVFAKATGQ